MRSLVACLCSIVLLASCGGKAPASKEVVVLCGSTMRGTFEAIKERYEKQSQDRVMLSFGDSGELCAQLKETRHGDIIICHDPFMGSLARQKLINRWANVAQLEIVVAVPKGNPKNITSVSDLGKSGIRLGVPDQNYSTAGQIVKSLLAKMPGGDAIRTNIIVESRSHHTRAMQVIEGALDAGIVWNAVAKQLGDKLDVIPVPKDYIDSVTSATYDLSDLRNVNVTVGVTEWSKDLEPVRHFYDFVTSPACRDIFEQQGYTVTKQ